MKLAERLRHSGVKLVNVHVGFAVGPVVYLEQAADRCVVALVLGKHADAEHTGAVPDRAADIILIADGKTHFRKGGVHCLGYRADRVGKRAVKVENYQLGVKFVFLSHFLFLCFFGELRSLPDKGYPEFIKKVAYLFAVQFIVYAVGFAPYRHKSRFKQ